MTGLLKRCMYWNWIQYMTTTCTTTSFNNVMIAYIAERERSNRRWIYILKKMYYADVFFREIFHRRFSDLPMSVILLHTYIRCNFL